VQMISRRESFDPAKARMVEATRQDNMAVHPVSPNDEGRKAHPNVKRDPCFFREHSHPAVLLRDRQQLIEDCAHDRWFSSEMGRQRVSAAGVRLVPIRKFPPAFRAAPHFRHSLNLDGPHGRGYRTPPRGGVTCDRSSDNAQVRCGNSRRSRVRGAGNSAGTCRT